MLYPDLILSEEGSVLKYLILRSTEKCIYVKEVKSNHNFQNFSGRHQTTLQVTPLFISQSALSQHLYHTIPIKSSNYITIGDMMKKEDVDESFNRTKNNDPHSYGSEQAIARKYTDIATLTSLRISNRQRHGDAVCSLKITNIRNCPNSLIEMRQLDDNDQLADSELEKNPLLTDAAQKIITTHPLPYSIKDISRAVELVIHSQGRGALTTEAILYQLKYVSNENSSRMAEENMGRGDLMKENRILRSSFQCVTCKNPRDAICTSCGYFVFCNTCASLILKCPYCR